MTHTRLPKRSLPKWLVVLVLLAEVGLFCVAVVFHKMEGGSFDGVTLCYPFRGPVQMFDTTLSDSAAILTRTHEAVHARQCREMGAVANFFARVTSKGRLRLEAQAYCAQAMQEVSWGAKPSMVFDRIVEELAETVVGRAYGSVDPAGIRNIMIRECPGLGVPPSPVRGRGTGG
jgi:hypothetical protein